MPFIVGILGLFIGSFLGVCVDRLPKNESIVTGRSHCSHCRHLLSWYDLLPVISFIVLKGKCRYCKKFFGWHYLAIEVVTGILFAFTDFKLVNFSPSLIFYLILDSGLVIILFSDLLYGVILDKVLIFLTLISIAYTIIYNHQIFFLSFFSALGAGLFFLLLFLITKGKGMGLGDVKYAFLMGFILGWPFIVIGLYTAFLTGAIVAFILIIWGKRKLIGGTLPFGPFLALGTYVSILFGSVLWQIFIKFLLAGG